MWFNNTHRRHCCVSTAKVVTRTHHNITLYCRYIILFEIACNFTIPAEKRRGFIKPYYLSYCNINNNYLSKNHTISHVITRNKGIRLISSSSNPLWVWCAVMAILNNTHTLPHHKPNQEWRIFFYVLLTAHLSIFILVINQLDAQHFVLQ